MKRGAHRLLETALETVPRVLGLCDRGAGSATAGCCDRAYWHYRILDFPNARFQEAGWLLALAYASDLPGNGYRGRDAVAGWVSDIWRFWLKRRNRDGSVCEVYPNERSFCATAFSAASFVESVFLLGGAGAWKGELRDAETTMSWLAANANPEVANQMAASLLALTGYAILTGGGGFAELARQRRGEVLRLMRDDGAFPEYGGLDLGYQSVTMSALARTAVLSGGDPDIEDALRRAERVLAAGVGADGAVDPADNSRRTQFLYPYSLALLESEALDRILDGFEKGVILRPTWMDDRFCIAMATDCLLASKAIVDANDTLQAHRPSPV